MTRISLMFLAGLALGSLGGAPVAWLVWPAPPTTFDQQPAHHTVNAGATTVTTHTLAIDQEVRTRVSFTQADESVHLEFDDAVTAPVVREDPGGAVVTFDVGSEPRGVTVRVE